MLEIVLLKDPSNFTLTTGVDAVADFTGTSLDDVFNAPATSGALGAAATTVNSGDTLDGGAGKDTLNITATGTNNNSLAGLTATSIETVNIAGGNNLGASSPAYAEALAAKATTAAALATKNTEAATAAGQKGAADRVAVLVDALGVGTGGVSANTNPLGEPAVISASTVTATTASQLAHAATAVAALTTVAAVTTASTSTVALAAGTSYTLDQYKAAALAALKGADGTTLDVSNATAVTERADALALAANAVWISVAATANDAVEAQRAAAAAAIVTVAGAAGALAAIDAAIATTDVQFATINTGAFTLAQYIAAATAVKTAFDGTTALTTNGDLSARAGVLSTFAADVVAVVGDYSLAQLNAAALAALSSSTGGSLLTAGNDEDAIEARADVLAAAATAVNTAAVAAAATALASDTAAANAVTIALASVGATSVAASQFADATVITLSGDSSKTNVTAVAATQIIGFSGVAGMDNTVGFGATVTAGLINSASSAGKLTVTGAGLTSLSLSGAGTTGLEIVNANPAGSTTKLAALNVNTTGTTILTTTGMVGLTSVTQSGAGGVVLNAVGTAATLATITTGAGADSVRVTTAVAGDVASTTINETVTAVVSTGGGIDRVVVETGGAANNGVTTVDMGDGDDTLVLTSINTGANTLSGGAGNDTFRIGAVSTLASTSISGGSGTDVLRTTNAAFTTADYTTLTANVSSVETLQLSASAVIDAGKVAMSRIEFFGTAANVVTDVSSAQTLAGVRTPVSTASMGIAAVAAATEVTNITATSKGYVAAGALTVFGDNLNISMSQAAAASTVIAKGNALTLSVGALAQSGAAAATGVTGIDTTVTVTGDVTGLSTTLTSVRGSGVFGLGEEDLAGLTVAVTTTNLQNMTSVTVSGSGTALINAGAIVALDAKLATINLSGMTALADLNALGQEIGTVGGVANSVGGFNNRSTSTVTLNDLVSETVLLGGAKDTVVTGSTLVKTDIITGFQVTGSAVNALVVDLDRSDVLDIGTAFDGSAAVGAATHAAKMTVTGSSLEAALLQAASLKGGANGTTDIDKVVFHFGGNTYVYVDTLVGGVGGLDDTDKLVQLSGTLNLDLLLQTGVIIA